jgi:hypothetical protein
MGSDGRALADRDRQWRESGLPPLHHGDRLPLHAKAAGIDSVKDFKGGLLHRPRPHEGDSPASASP